MDSKSEVKINTSPPNQRSVIRKRSALNLATKKYSYIVRTYISEEYVLIARKIQSLVYKYNPADLSPLNYHSLPHPYPWRRYLQYRKLYVEIGTGHGEQLTKLAKDNPDNLYIGFEIFKQFAMLTHKRVKQFGNALVFKTNAYEAILRLFQRNSISGVYVLFPDPWHKKRHHKRRPLTAKWFRSCSKMLTKDGFIFFASDWKEYYDFVLNEANQLSDLYRVETGKYTPSDWDCAQTHYYKKWCKAGREFNYILLTIRV